eukprot:850023-Pleurochrysis_carterae.AAC.1
MSDATLSVTNGTIRHTRRMTEIMRITYTIGVGSISITNIRLAHLKIRPTMERVGRILWNAGVRLPLPELVFARASLDSARDHTLPPDRSARVCAG